MGQAPRVEPVGSCPLCGHSSSTLMFTIPDRLHAVPGEFTYRRCEACETVFQDPRVTDEDLIGCYPADYYTHGATARAAPDTKSVISPQRVAGRRAAGVRDAVRDQVVAHMRGSAQAASAVSVGRYMSKFRRVRERAFHGLLDEIITPTPGSARALDIGCGAGRLLVALDRAGWEAEGVEWDPTAVETARVVSGRPVFAGDFRELDLPLASYDLIVLSHVFEHLADPVASLRRVRELLAPGGRSVIAAPHPGSVGARLYGGQWFPWEAPRHLVLPSWQAWARAAADAGLRLAGQRTTARDAAVYLAHSRAYRDGAAVDTSQPRIGAQDRLLASGERLLMVLGGNVGEEVIVVLEHEQPNHQPA